ncbi:MAG: hypothetical protein ACYC96_02085 [Fimbriimonadaceae bacterium]
MTRVAVRRVWSVPRKLVGNALPLVCAAPILALGWWLWAKGAEWDAIGVAAIALVVAAVSLNWLGLAGNARMRRALAARLKPPAGAVFVGFSRPGYFDILDPHEDLGFLRLEAEALVIVGEAASIRMMRSRELRVTYEFNPHTLLGLGRWLAIRGDSEAGPVRVLVEPRELGSLRANRALGTRLKTQLEAWRTKDESAS